jgi:hypothetical protein
MPALGDLGFTLIIVIVGLVIAAVCLGVLDLMWESYRDEYDTRPLRIWFWATVGLAGAGYIVLPAPFDVVAFLCAVAALLWPVYRRAGGWRQFVRNPTVPDVLGKLWTILFILLITRYWRMPLDWPPQPILLLMWLGGFLVLGVPVSYALYRWEKQAHAMAGEAASR